MEEILKKFSLINKVAVITGASRGIGEGIAQAYAKAGAKIVVCSRKQRGVDEAVARIKKEGGEALPVAANVSLPEDRNIIIQKAIDWAGRIDILVNNAGANPMLTTWADMPESVWDKVFEVNLKAAFILSQLSFHAWMKENGGIILNVSSVAGFQTLQGAPAYNVAKAAIMHFTRCLAGEWGQYGIRVNCIAPGFIKTQFNRALWQSPICNDLIKSFPIARMGLVEDLKAAALLLASDASSFITGHTMVIDGGELVKSEPRV